MLRDYEARLVDVKSVGDGLFHLTLRCPELASQAQPGNFAMFKTSTSSAPLLRRPLGILDADPSEGTFEILFRVIGEGTALLSQLREGEIIPVRGPAGGEFAKPVHERTLAVAGTLGVVPLLFMRSRYGAFGKFLLGVPNERWALFAGWVRMRVPELVVYSDDGSLGKKGFCTAGLDELEPGSVSIAACGPNIMMKTLYEKCGDKYDDIQVSLEKRMACGFGGCFGCVVDTTTGRRRVCVDGPVFQAKEVCWNELHL